VSKTKSAELVRVAYGAGQRFFGENYVVELVNKAEELHKDLPDIRWHFIGPIQSNKIRKIVGVPGLACVESIDRAKIATGLERVCAEEGRSEPLAVMVQVNVSGEESKSGCAPEEAPELAHHIAQSCPNLKLLGLMTIGAPDPSREPVAFSRLLECRAAVSQRLGVAPASLELSMGMSADFEAATRMGSTSVRVGSTIFGERFYPPQRA